jgi:endogenous inhibitor of DNA gyrase (YacG/DUF329 family)
MNQPSIPPMLCPICKKPVDQSEKRNSRSYYPFCSERCKLIDLGRWLGGKYQIPVVEKDESDPREES